MDRRIRRYASAKRKLIALLEEERQAIVRRAATRGLDLDVRLKPSGVSATSRPSSMARRLPQMSPHSGMAKFCGSLPTIWGN